MTFGTCINREEERKRLRMELEMVREFERRYHGKNDSRNCEKIKEEIPNR